MDPLSGVLSLLKPHNTMCGAFDVGGEWSFQFPQHDGMVRLQPTSATDAGKGGN
jgi:hypothetical protein